MSENRDIRVRGECSQKMEHFDPRKRRHRVKVTALGDKRAKFIPFSLKSQFLVENVKMAQKGQEYEIA